MPDLDQTSPTAPEPAVAAPVTAPSSPPSAPMDAGARLAQNIAQAAPEPQGSVQQPPVVPGQAQAAAPHSEPQAAPAVDPFVSRLQQLGFAQLESPEQARDRLLEAFVREREEREHWQRQHQQVAPYAQQYAQLQQDPRWQAFNQHQPQQAQTPEHWWNPPQFDPSRMDEYREQVIGPDGKPTGEVRWKQDTPADYQQAAAQYGHYLKDWQTNLVTNPQEILPKIIQHEVMPLIRQALEQDRRQNQYLNFAQSVEQRHADWLYERDPVSQQPLRDMGGQPVFSQQGQMVNQLMARGRNYGIREPEALWQFAMQGLELEMRRGMQQQQASVQQAADINQQKKLEHLTNAATASSGRTGGIAPPHDPSSRQRGKKGPVDAGARLQNALREQGLSQVAPFQPQ